MSYDEIKAILQAELNQALARRKIELFNRSGSDAAVRRAASRYNRFTLHGIIPEDFKEEDGGVPSGRPVGEYGETLDLG